MKVGNLTMQLLMVRRKVKNLGHLSGCISAGAGIDHGQQRREYIRREKEISLLTCQSLDQLKGELRTATNEEIPFTLPKKHFDLYLLILA